MSFVKCRDCHRPLRDPVSRERGYGSQCWREHRPAAAARHSPATRRRPASAIPGQIPLDLDTEPLETS